MSIRNLHPEYSQFLPIWTQMRDFYKGAKAVKAKGKEYLPPTTGMVLDGLGVGQIGKDNYEAYLARAVFPDYVKEGVEALMGLIHQHDAKIEVPPRMQYLLEKATINGESLALLLRRINEEQLVAGRLGLLVDLPKNPDPANPMPFISLYIAEAITNWDDGSSKNDSSETSERGINELELVVLDETNYVRDGFSWRVVPKMRVLELSENADETTGPYQQGLFVDSSYAKEQMSTPMLRGKSLKKIPFVFINSKDLLPEPDQAPLEGLGLDCLTIYRGEADYRQNLHMQGQDTLVTIGGVRNATGVPGQDDDAVRVGAGSRIDVDLQGDAKFIGVSSLGLLEQRNAIENDRKRAEFKAGQLIGNQSLKNESGSAMIARLAAQTANLNQISMTSGEALQKALRFIAEWMGEDPMSCKVLPNTEFTNAATNAQELVYLMTARKMGAPLSMQSIHTSLKDRNYTSLDYDTEMALVTKEGPNDVTTVTVTAPSSSSNNDKPIAPK